MRTRIASSGILAGCMCLLGCSGLPAKYPYEGPPATVAYMAGNGGVGNWGINEYSTVAAGGSAPLGVLTVPQPYYPVLFTTDLAGQIYVDACSSKGGEDVFVYPPNSVGTATPSRTIAVGSCPNGWSNLVAFAVDPAGRLYLATGAQNGNLPTASIFVYSQAPNGSGVPLRSLQLTNVPNIFDMAVDASGNIYLVTGSPSGDSVINVYGPSEIGPSAPIRTINFGSSSSVYGVAVDASADIFANVCLSICEGTDWAIEEFAPGANGAAIPVNTINLMNVPRSSPTHGVWGGPVRLDGAGNIFTSLTIETMPLANVTYLIYGFGPNATGNATPTVQITTEAPEVDGPRFAVN